MASADDRRLILAHTEVASVPLCPEIRLHLITPACPLWRASERDAARLGLPNPFWGFAWPGGQAVARTVLDRPELVSGRRVLDFGAGGGIGALAACLAGARCVCAADIDPLAVLAAGMNAGLNGVAVDLETRNLVGDEGLEWDVVLAGDVCYDTAETAEITGWLRSLARRGARVLLGDPGRGFLRTDGLEVLGRHQATADNDRDGSVTVDTVVAAMRPE